MAGRVVIYNPWLCSLLRQFRIFSRALHALQFLMRSVLHSLNGAMEQVMKCGIWSFTVK